ncbi:cell wall hydrolase [Alkaliphilus pronyensis]|nr:cell wall hydrolase [Alkaliphilus pronyensis]
MQLLISGTRLTENSIAGYTTKDIDYLAKIIHAEARGESFEGMVAIGAVILNRVEDDSFPSTIEEVIFQPNQFCSVKDGQFHLEPSRLAYDAAFRAIMGNDPTNGCLFFYNPQIATAVWSFQRPVEAVIGNHRFTK